MSSNLNINGNWKWITGILASILVTFIGTWIARGLAPMPIKWEKKVRHMIETESPYTQDQKKITLQLKSIQEDVKEIKEEIKEIRKENQ